MGGLLSRLSTDVTVCPFDLPHTVPAEYGSIARGQPEELDKLVVDGDVEVNNKYSSDHLCEHRNPDTVTPCTLGTKLIPYRGNSIP